MSTPSTAVVPAPTCVTGVTLTGPQVAGVEAVIKRAAERDGVLPLSEQARLQLRRSEAGAIRHCLLLWAEQVVGYAQLDLGDPVGGPCGELVIDPAWRSRGLGGQLLEHLRTLAGGRPGTPLLIWARGGTPAGVRLAEGKGMVPLRVLLRMERSLRATLPQVVLPDGVAVRRFRPGQDDAAVLAVNGRAFADLRDQGRWGAEDLALRMAQPWFDPAGLLLAHAAGDPDALLGFHWTKVHDPWVAAPAPDPAQDRRMGEVYVLAVEPSARGRGLGSALLVAGLAHLQQRGLAAVTLYVDAANTPAVALYQRLGFLTRARDTLYTDPHPAPDRPDLAEDCQTEAMTMTVEPSPVRGSAVGERYLDREMSWLAFNTRVLDLTRDEEAPLLERAKFLAIFASNLDEFFMVRVAGLRRRIEAGIAVRSASGRLPRELLSEILTASRVLMGEHSAIFHNEIRPGLQAHGIDLLRWAELSASEQAGASTLFRERVFPVLTPLAVDPAHPFPYISGLSLNLAVLVRNPESGEEHFARVKVPPLLARFLRVGGQRFVPLEDVIAAHLELLFPGMEILQHQTFRVTRNEDVEVEEDDAENLLTAMEKELTRRRFGPPVRLEVESSIDVHVLDLLMRELDVGPEAVFHLEWPLDLRGLWDVYALDREDLKAPAFQPRTSPGLTGVESSAPPDVLEAMRRNDVLLHHPYDSFATSVQRFLEQAAADPDVLAIKQTLYRTSGDSPIVSSLIAAAEAGKQVLALVEIKARFDEEANISWARKLEQVGVHVVYGIVGLKTHAKLSMVIRQEGANLRRYVHIGTGNYHPKTARQYEDLGLLTTNEEIADDVSRLFNRLSGYALATDYRRLLVAPHGVRSGLIEAIEDEIAHHAAGRPARVRIKCNAISDEQSIDALYRAAAAGVPVDIWVRGTCSIRPNVPGLSEGMRVISILGRFLEHSRIFEFANGGDPRVWIGSADLMHRNLDRRVEALVSVPSPEHRTYLGWLFDLAFDPGTSSWRLDPAGTWHRTIVDADGEPLLDLQEALIRRKHLRLGT